MLFDVALVLVTVLGAFLNRLARKRPEGYRGWFAAARTKLLADLGHDVERWVAFVVLLTVVVNGGEAFREAQGRENSNAGDLIGYYFLSIFDDAVRGIVHDVLLAAVGFVLGLALGALVIRPAESVRA